MTKIYITKYALTAGIISVDARIIEDEEKMAAYKIKDAYFEAYVHNNDFWFTEEDALKRANEMRERKLASLEKQKKKLIGVVFDIKECESGY